MPTKNVYYKKRFSNMNFYILSNFHKQKIEVSKIKLPDESDTNLLSVLMQFTELTQNIDQRALAKTVLNRSMKCNCWQFF